MVFLENEKYSDLCKRTQPVVGSGGVRKLNFILLEEANSVKIFKTSAKLTLVAYKHLLLP